MTGQAIRHVARSVKFWVAHADVQETAQRAAALAHADLATAVVMEMTALAGTMGRHYAQQDGLPGPVCEAIYEMVLPRNAGDTVPSTPAGTEILQLNAHSERCRINVTEPSPKCGDRCGAKLDDGRLP